MAKKRGGGGPKKDHLDPIQVQREYGFAYSFFKSDKELWNLLQKAVKGGWQADLFQAHFRNTKWFKTHSDVWRQTTALKYTDPASYRERLGNMTTQIQNLAGQWGVEFGKGELARYSERALLFGWSPEQVIDHIAQDIRPDKNGHFGGQGSGLEEQLRQTAFANGVNINNDQLTGWIRSIAKGDADVNQFQTYIRDISAKTFSAYGDSIKAGVNAADLAAPYMQSMADILEINPKSIDMTDRTIRSAMSYRDPKTGEATPMSLTDFEDSLRQDKRWQYTQNAKETLTGYANQLAKMWGLS